MSIFEPPTPRHDPPPSAARARALELWAKTTPVGRFTVLVVGCALLPVVVSSDYIVRVGVNTLIYALLALGLNVVVGWAGLLDLGYVAFFGFGGYAYALLSSNQFHLHWPAVASVPLIIAASAVLGLLIGLPSRRLFGDYLAILTLFFGQAFVTLVSNADRITPFGFRSPVNFTGGPNGINGLDNIHSFGITVSSVRGYFYLSLVVFVLVAAALYSVNLSRTGRAWRSLREDPLAAELMGMPVNRLKLLAFMFGAAVAGLTGTIFAALQVGVFPGNFEIPLLIMIYAMVILGGAGSMTGVIAGAVTVNVVLEILRTPDPSRMVFYGVIVAALLTFIRPYVRLAAIVVGTAVFGIVVHLIVTRLAPAATQGTLPGGGTLGRVMDHWVILLTNPSTPGHIAYAGLLVAVALLTQVKGVWRTILIVPTLYVAAFTWENVLVDNPSVARLILLGALLIALMNARPQGLFGTARIEIA
ncbi:MAG TPA: branched-chain amino acid ABC transporter permease [Gaiellaceae bacterium]|jgi:branched-chain amino acid transport system permease protein|nr:branched-chain amino acid ABC transporter permease [Gaiellaceae bacterium]